MKGVFAGKPLDRIGGRRPQRGPVRGEPDIWRDRDLENGMNRHTRPANRRRLGRDGGYILAGSQVLTGEIPVDNSLAMFF